MLIHPQKQMQPTPSAIASGLVGYDLPPLSGSEEIHSWTQSHLNTGLLSCALSLVPPETVNKVDQIIRSYSKGKSAMTMTNWLRASGLTFDQILDWTWQGCQTPFSSTNFEDMKSLTTQLHRNGILLQVLFVMLETLLLPLAKSMPAPSLSYPSFSQCDYMST